MKNRLDSVRCATFAKEIVQALDLQEGDELAFRVKDGRVLVTTTTPKADPFALFDEWSSEADRVGYAGL